MTNITYEKPFAKIYMSDAEFFVNLSVGCRCGGVNLSVGCRGGVAFGVWGAYRGCRRNLDY
jgi:hypothetical protein